MLYEVSGQVTFDTLAHAQAALTAARNAWPNACGKWGDSEPTMTVEPDGSRTVTMSMRFSDIAARNTVRDWLVAHQAWIKANTSGYISHHVCHHDEGVRCEPATVVQWGT